jgi:hypothetical protein
VLHIVPRIRYLRFTTRGKKGPLTMTGDLSACKSKRTLIQLLTVNRHARVSDLVAQTSHRPLSPLFAPALLQIACSLSLNLVSCCEARSMPCACIRMPRVMDGHAVSRGLCFTHGNPTLQPSYFTMVNTVSPAHASLCS